MEPLFSIVTPTLNCVSKLQATVRSVLAQENTFWEYWIVDGGSTDDTIPYLRQLDSRVRWISEPDGGVYDAMNKGAAQSSGRFRYFLGAGDILKPNILHEIEKIIRRVDNIAPLFLYGDVQLVASGMATYGGLFSKEMFAQRNICHQAIFYDRRIFDLLGDYDLKYRMLADRAYNLRCFSDARINKMHVDLIIAEYEGGGISSTVRDEAFHADLPQMIRQYIEEAEDSFPPNGHAPE